jgi:hypothetical protein
MSLYVGVGSVLGINRWWTVAKTLLISGLLLLNLWGCSDRSKVVSVEPPAPGAPPVKLAGKISEVSPPAVIQELRLALEKYQPQVAIVSPRADEVLQDDAVEIRLQVKDLPIYKDETLGLGSHLHVFLDNQPYQAVYDTSQPVTLTDLTPGTHTLRVFASRPWHESFKNDGAYAQTTFHVFTKTSDHNPDPNLPLLTYSRPQGMYGAEPILLDFYLTNAPLHLVAKEDEQDDVVDWRIKVTVNGESFVIDRWQPLYLKGFKPGKNWVQLEYIDEKGNSIQNVYNNTPRVFTYEPNGKDTLSKLVRGEISAAEARSIVDQNYQPGVPEPTPSLEPIPVAPSPVPEVSPAPKVEVTPEPTEKLTEEETKPAIDESPEPKGFFNRFRRPEMAKPIPSVTPEPIPSVEPIPEEAIEPATPSEKSIPELPVPPVQATPKGKKFFDRFRRPEMVKPTPSVIPEPIPSVKPIPEEAIEPSEEPILELPVSPVQETPKGGFFDRFRRPEMPKPSPSISPKPLVEEPVEKVEPEEAPSSPKIDSPETPETAPPFRSELEKRLGMPLNPPIASPVRPTPIEVKPAEPKQPDVKVAEPSNQLRRPVESIAPPEAPIKLPETLEAPSEESTPIPSIQ